MPPVIVPIAIALGASAATAAVIAAVVTQVLITLAITVVLGAIMKAIAKSPSNANNTLQSRSVMVKQPISPWQLPYGQVNVSGVIPFMASYASITPGAVANPDVNINVPNAGMFVG